EMLPRVFELFVQADTPSVPGQGGLGIGLTLVKSLVELHGGAVEAQSLGLGKGSEFTVRLPLATAADPVEPPAMDAQLRGFSRRKIALVEDDADSRDRLAETLELRGPSV